MVVNLTRETRCDRCGATKREATSLTKSHAPHTAFIKGIIYMTPSNNS
jgi:hypothetical protein